MAGRCSVSWGKGKKLRSKRSITNLNNKLGREKDTAGALGERGKKGPGMTT